MRNAFIEELIRAAEVSEKIALVVGDLGYGVVEPFAKRFPKQFFNAGVAEQNMMGLSAGLASEGYQVFAYSIANFPTFRCAEQIRNDVDYHQLPVTIVAVGGGLAYGNLGYSHHAVQDYGLMRLFPNMLIAAPGDPMEVRACMRYIVQNPQPSYLRLGKAGEKNIHEVIPEISPGQWLSVSEGEVGAGTYLTTGTVLENTKNFFDKELKDLGWSLNSMPLWGMKFKTSQDKNFEKYSSVYTVEDHLGDGGFGSWLMESVSSNKDALMKINVRSLDAKVCGMVASQSTLFNEGGLNLLDYL
jgi:transketolase